MQDFTIITQMSRLGLYKKVIAKKRNMVITLSFKDEYILFYDGQSKGFKKYSLKLEAEILEAMKNNNYSLETYKI